MTGWTTVADIHARIRRRWDDGTLLRALSAGDPFPVIEIPLSGPRPAQIGDDLAAVQSWIAALDSGRRDDRHYSLEFAPVGGRVFGRNRIPSRAKVATYDQVWALLGVGREVSRYREILALAAAEPAVRSWIASQPLRALALDPAWPALLAAYRWLSNERDSGKYLREISAPGVDTKFVEQHRAVLSRLLGVPASSTSFIAALGLRAKPELIRVRSDPALRLAGQFSDATVRVEELAQLDLEARRAVIVENEITFLSVPVPAGGVAIWGKGFEVNRPGSLPWLRGTEVHYWGDLDTHGFAILSQLRAWLPQTRSFLMDRETLLDHRGRWVQESSPTAAALERLTTDEAALYSDLVTDRLGLRVRLEQERIDWVWAEKRLPYV
ncbi:Wadjet anti-phage system protein JetD domain-containing protein [Kribbella sp. NPDC050470]|uniref:Wadjet anti-phage system protein JetD domain-containing protein n=1 Tax=unclassified Kribbella TaxID=2644121 RepID=UPI0037BDB33E